MLVKWWLLAIPHYVVLARASSAAAIWLATDGDGNGVGHGRGPAADRAAGVHRRRSCLLFTGRYPRPLYDFVLGMDRWVLRVAAYAGLMTDDYPPFRLDMGGPDPGSVPAAPIPPAPAGAPAVPRTGDPAPAAARLDGRPRRHAGHRVGAALRRRGQPDRRRHRCCGPTRPSATAPTCPRRRPG